ncbi:MAG TPA: alpha/beta fold hydrolase [Geothrix sp.]|nr:alpha/beta fold hydrolase [Geothrix sp.]
MTPILIIPGHFPSGEGHWQNLWEEALPEGRRVFMPNRQRPVLADWIWTLEDAIADCEAPPILVAHSLGCIAVAHWAVDHAKPVRGALLVAPLDVEQPESLAAVRPFSPIPRFTLPFPTIVAASSNDPYMALDRARELATDWGARFVDLGPRGHMNAASGHGPWIRGEALLAELR